MVSNLPNGIKESRAALYYTIYILYVTMERYRSGHNEAVLKTVCPKGRVGSNPTLSVRFQQIVLRSMAVDGILQIQSRDCHIGKCESAHGEVPKMAEGTPLERVQVVNSGARVQIPPSPFAQLD